MKKIQKIIFSILAVLLVVQSMNTGVFANTQTDEVPEVEVVEKEEPKKEENIEEEVELPKSNSNLGFQKLAITFIDSVDTQGKTVANVTTGIQTTGTLSFAIDGPSNLENEELLLRLSVPKGKNFIINDSSEFTATFGSIDDPNGADDPTSNYMYVWLRIKGVLQVGEVRNIQFYITPFKVGIGAGDNVEVKADAFIDEGGIQDLDKSVVGRMVSHAPIFTHNPVSNSGSYKTQSITNQSGDTLTTISITQTGSANTNKNSPGVVYTEKYIFTNTFKMPVDNNGNPLIHITRADIVKTNGDAFTNAELSVSTKGGFVTEFTVITEVTATPGVQLDSGTAGFKLLSPKYDADQIQATYNLQSGDQKQLIIENTHREATAISAGAVSGQSGKQFPLTVNTIPNIVITYTNADEVGDEAFNQKFSKRTVRIANIDTTNAQMDNLAVYQNDIVTFDFGANWRNTQRKTIDKLVFSEYSDHASGLGYKSSEMIPLRINTGIMTRTGGTLTTVQLDVIVTYKSGGTETLITLNGEELMTKQTVAIPVDKQDDVSKIEFVYTNLDSNSIFQTPPSIDYRILEQKDPTAQGKKISNKAELSLTYEGVTKVKESNEVYFRYRDANAEKSGVYGTNKSGSNLGKHSFQQENDVYLFTIELENTKNDPVTIKTLNDLFTYNLSPYKGTKGINGDLTSEDIDPKFINPDPSDLLNLVYWDMNVSETEPAADQSVIESVNIVESSTKELSKMEIVFEGAGITIAPNQVVKLTYTMYVNDQFEEDATISNSYKTYDDADEHIVSGNWSSSKNIDHPKDDKKTYGKSGVNLSGVTLGEFPFTRDIVLYTLDIGNDKEFTWENIILKDTYSEKTSPYHSLSLIEQDLIDRFGLEENPTSMNLSVKKDSDGNLLMPAGFDISKVTMVLDESTNSFTIDLGDNEIKPEEKLSLIYTMRITDDAVPSSSIINTYKVFADDEYVADGKHTWAMNAQAQAEGVVSAIHSVDGKIIDGVKANVNGLLDGEELEFKIEMSNYLPRTDRIVNVKNVIGYLPKHVLYKEDSLKVYSKITTRDSSGDYVTTEAIIPDTEYTLALDSATNSIKVMFNNDYQLPGGIQGSDYNTSMASVLVVYDGIVDSSIGAFGGIDSDKFNEAVNSTAVAFYKENHKLLIAKNGTLKEKTPESKYQDGDANTLSYISNYSSTLYVLNENDPFGDISKFVHGDDRNIDLMTETDPTRRYSIGLYNTAFKQFTTTHVVDLLAKYETVDTTKPITITDTTPGGTGDTYDAVYTVDTVEVDGKEYNRLTITGYLDNGVETPIVMKAIKQSGKYSAWTIDYTAKINSEAAKKDLFVADSYTGTFENKVAMYTEDPITLSGVNVSNKTVSRKQSDNNPDNDWDSDPSTTVRYETQVPVYSTLSAVAPFMGIKAQVIEITQSGTTYRDARPTDFIDPGDYVGWKVTIGNSNRPNTPVIKEGSIVGVEIPYGLEFDGYKDGIAPDFLDEIDVSSSVLRWKTNKDIPANSVANVFTFRTKTLSNYFETYTVDGYFIPVDVSEFGFINSKIRATNEYRNYKFQPNTGVVPEELGFGNNPVSHVVTTENANVMGNLYIGGHMEVQSTTNSNLKASTSNAPHFTTLNDVEDIVRYTMLFEVYKPAAGIKNITLINRLGGEDDLYVYRKQPRRSEGKVVLSGDGSFEVSLVNATTGSFISDIDESDYIIEYSVMGYDQEILPKDWKHDNFDLWLTEAELLAQGYTYQDVTATRIKVSNNVTVDMNQAIKITYLAELKDYHMETWKVNNSFAYAVDTSNDNVSYTIETRDIGLKSKIETDRLKVTTEVIDPALIPLQTDFELDIVGYDKVTGDEALRVTKQISVIDISGVLQNISYLEELSRDMRFEVEPKSYIGFRTPTVDVTSSTDNYGLTTWEAHVVYERIVYDEVLVDVEVKTINDKYPVNTVDYNIVAEAQGSQVDSIDRRVQVSNKAGQDLVTTLETGSTYTLTPQEIKNYKVEVIELDSEDLDTTGVKSHFKLVYTQQEEDSSKDKDNKKPGTGIENNQMIFIGVIVGAIAIAVILLLTKRSKKDK